jgi:hypothetical protein
MFNQNINIKLKYIFDHKISLYNFAKIICKINETKKIYYILGIKSMSTI